MTSGEVIKFLALILCLAAVCFARPNSDEKESKDPLARAFKNIPKEERVDFISYFLALAIKDWAESQPRPPKFISPTKEGALIRGLNIPKDQIKKYQEMNIPKESRKKLLSWTKAEFNLNTRQVIELLRSKCEGSECAIIGVGDICCPW